MRTLVLLLLFLCACLLNAQSPTQGIGDDSISIASRQMEIYSRMVHQQNAEEAKQTKANREAEIARRQFWDKANQFVALWGDFAKRLNEKQTFDVKLAKKLSKAFHELETSDGWPTREQLNANNRSR